VQDFTQKKDRRGGIQHSLRAILLPQPACAVITTKLQAAIANPNGAIPYMRRTASPAPEHSGHCNPMDQTRCIAPLVLWSSVGACLMER